MRSRITDLFERLIISLYTYIPPRRRKDYYSIYYSNKPLDKVLKADKTKNYITSDRWLIFNEYKTDSTYGQQTFECPNKIYQQIIDLKYQDQENNEQLYKTGDRLMLNLTDPNTLSIFLSKIFENYVRKNVTITSLRISLITDLDSSRPKNLNE